MKIFKSNYNNNQTQDYIIVCGLLESCNLVKYLYSLEKNVECESPYGSLDDLHLEKCEVRSVYNIDMYQNYDLDTFKYHAFLLEGFNIKGKVVYRWSNLPNSISKILYDFDEIYKDRNRRRVLCLM